MPEMSGIVSDIVAYIGIDGEDKINTTLGSIKGKFTGLADAVSLTSPVGIALSAAATVLGAAATAAYSFDSGINKLRGTLNLDRGEIATIGSQLRDIANVNPLTYTELFDGLAAIHAEGVPASHYTALLAEAATAASTGMGSMMDIIKGGIDSYERYADYSSDLAIDQATLRDVYDKQFAIVGTGAINYKDLVEYTGRLLPIANSLGLPMEQLYAAIATLNVNEVKPTGLLMFLQSVSKNRDKWEDIGVEVFDPLTGSIRGLDDIVKQFATVTAGKSKEEVSDLYNYLGLNRMTGPLFDTLLANVGTFSGHLTTIATSEGEVRDRAKEATDNMDAQWQMIKNNFSAEMINLGTSVLPPVVDLLKAINTEIGSYSNKPDIQGAGPLTASYVEPAYKFTEYITADGTVQKVKGFTEALAGTDGKGGVAGAIGDIGNAAGGPDKSDGASERVNALNIKMKEWAGMSEAEKTLAGIKNITGTLATNAEAAAYHIGELNYDIKPEGTDWRDYIDNFRTLSGLIGTTDTGLVGGMRGLRRETTLVTLPVKNAGDAAESAGKKVADKKKDWADYAKYVGDLAENLGIGGENVSTLVGILANVKQGSFDPITLGLQAAGFLIAEMKKDHTPAITNWEGVVSVLGTAGTAMQTLNDGLKAFNAELNLTVVDKLQADMEAVSFKIAEKAAEVKAYGDGSFLGEKAKREMEALRAEYQRLALQAKDYKKAFELEDTYEENTDALDLLAGKWIDLDDKFGESNLGDLKGLYEATISQAELFLGKLDPQSSAFQTLKDRIEAAKLVLDGYISSMKEYDKLVNPAPPGADVNPSIEAGVGSYATGGYVPNAGLAMLHGNEFVLNRQATSAIGPGALSDFNATLDPAVLAGQGGSRYGGGVVINVQAIEATPATYFKISDRYMQPRMNQRSRRFEVEENPYAK